MALEKLPNPRSLGTFAKYKNKNFNNYLALKNYERELSLLVRIKKGEYLKRDANIKNKKLTYQVTEGKEK